MLNFKVSAPGKVILFGEHSVVHGKSAIAGSINLRSTLSFQMLPSSETSIRLISSTTNVDKRLPLNQLEDHFLESFRPRYKVNPEEFLNHLESFLHALDIADSRQKMCFQATLFLLVTILQSRGITTLKPFSVNGETELSIGSGLGSSASFAVCLATCFLHYTNHVLEKPTELTSEFLNEVSNFAFECEKLMHGTPSGIDNTICTYGSLLKFKREEQFKTIPCSAAMKIMLVDTRVPRSTKVLVQNVRELKTKYPKVFDPILEAMDEVALIGLQIVQNIMQRLNDDEDCSEDYKILKMFMEKNQHLLSAIECSHPTLDTICREAQSFGFGAKLTGAGGGGYAYVVIPPKTLENDVEALKKKLIEHGFGVLITSIGGPGVQIH